MTFIKLPLKTGNHSLPPANEVWGKVICLQACVCPRGGVSAPGGGGCLLQGGCLLPGGSAPGGCPVETPPMATAEGSTHPTGMHSCSI